MVSQHEYSRSEGAVNTQLQCEFQCQSLWGKLKYQVSTDYFFNHKIVQHLLSRPKYKPFFSNEEVKGVRKGKHEGGEKKRLAVSSDFMLVFCHVTEVTPWQSGKAKSCVLLQLSCLPQGEGREFEMTAFWATSLPCCPLLFTLPKLQLQLCHLRQGYSPAVPHR